MLARVEMMNACTRMVSVAGAHQVGEQREHHHDHQGAEPGPGHVPT